MNEATVSHYNTDVAAECEGVDPVEGDEPGAGQGGEGEVKTELDCTRMVSPAPTTIAR